MSDNTWVCQLTLEMCKQLPDYNGTPLEKVHGEGSPRRRGGGREPRRRCRRTRCQQCQGKAPEPVPRFRLLLPEPVWWLLWSWQDLEQKAVGWRLETQRSTPTCCSSDTAQSAPGPCSGVQRCVWPMVQALSAPLRASLHWGAGTTPCLASLQNFLYKCVGTTLGAASSKEVVRKHLQELLETARYQEEREREVPAPQRVRVCARVCARVRAPPTPPCPGVSAPVPPQGLACCFGICATSHLDDTLAQLEDFVKSDVLRKSAGIFNIFKVVRSG